MARWYKKALDFDGVDDMVDCLAPVSLQITDNLGVSIWVECGAQSINDYIIQRWDSGANTSWTILTSAGWPRKLRLVMTDNGTYDAVHAKDWTTTNDVLPVSGWAHIFLGFASGTVTLKVNNVEITAFTITHDGAIVALNAAPLARLRIGRTSLGWQGKVANAFITDTAVPSAADVTFFYGGGPGGIPGDPLLWTPTGSAALVSSWIWDDEMLLVPGANDVLDRYGSNHGTTYNMDAADVVDTPWLGPKDKWNYRALHFSITPWKSVDLGTDSSLKDAVGFTVGGLYYHKGVAGTIFRDYDAAQNRWQITVPAGAATKIEFYITSAATGAPGNRKIWRSIAAILTPYTWYRWAFSFAADDPKFYLDAVEITSWTKTENSVVNALFAGVGPVRWNVSIDAKQACMFYFNKVLSLAEIVELHGQTDPTDPQRSSAFGNLVSLWGWLPDYPALPGANDVPDQVGTNHGTTTAVTADDIVLTPWLGPWAHVVRTFVHNRATRISDGARTTWASSNGADPAMAYHPDVVYPADYEDFVVIGGSYG